MGRKWGWRVILFPCVSRNNGVAGRTSLFQNIEKLKVRFGRQRPEKKINRKISSALSKRVRHKSNLIYSVGTQVVSLKPVQGSHDRMVHPSGAVGVIVKSPIDRAHCYRVRFLDGFEAALQHDQLVLLADYQEGEINDATQVMAKHGLFDRVIFRCVIGSRAYGLDDENSDIDRRGIYLPTANLHWSLYGVPEQLENDATQEVYWELQKLFVLALKANPNVLECLYSPMVETATPLAKEILAEKEIFLSKVVFQTYSGYVASQFKKMQTDIRNQGRVKWKHVMHLIRLLLPVLGLGQGCLGG